jgi:hypothetical protein
MARDLASGTTELEGQLDKVIEKYVERKHRGGGEVKLKSMLPQSAMS